MIKEDKKRAEMFPFEVPEHFRLKAIALNCGVYEIHMDDEGSLDRELMDEYLPGKGTGEELEWINALHGITENYPPTLYMTCTGDFLQEQVLNLQKTLIAHQVSQEFLYYGDRDTELGHVFHLNMKSEIAKQCNMEECGFFRRWIDKA